MKYSILKTISLEFFARKKASDQGYIRKWCIKDDAYMDPSTRKIVSRPIRTSLALSDFLHEVGHTHTLTKSQIEAHSSFNEGKLLGLIYVDDWNSVIESEIAAWDWCLTASKVHDINPFEEKLFKYLNSYIVKTRTYIDDLSYANKKAYLRLAARELEWKS